VVQMTTRVPELRVLERCQHAGEPSLAASAHLEAAGLSWAAASANQWAAAGWKRAADDQTTATSSHDFPGTLRALERPEHVPRTAVVGKRRAGAGVFLRMAEHIPTQIGRGPGPQARKDNAATPAVSWWQQQPEGPWGTGVLCSNLALPGFLRRRAWIHASRPCAATGEAVGTAASARAWPRHRCLEVVRIEGIELPAPDGLVPGPDHPVEVGPLLEAAGSAKVGQGGLTCR
jgi:hypothetical protein